MARRITALALGFVLALSLAACAPMPYIPDLGETTGSVDVAELPPDAVSELKPAAGYRTTHPAPYDWAEGTVLIAHGMGGVDGKRVTESLEAFKANYARGYRVFEVDLIRSTDGKLIGRHDWEAYLYNFLGQKTDNPYRKMSAAEFKSTKIHGDMTPLTIDDIITIMRAYPDVYIMTDTKDTSDEGIASAMREIVAAMGDDAVLAERLIIQIYTESGLKAVRGVHDFKNIVYTLYQLKGTTKEGALDFSAANDVRVIAMPDTMWNAQFASLAKSKGLIAGVYTVNDKTKSSKMAKSGVTLFYSDFLVPSDLKK